MDKSILKRAGIENEESKKSEEKPNIVFDFDGVIHSYKSGWKGNNVIPDEPVEGIREAIGDLRKDHKVIVVSTRCAEPGGIDAIKKYLADNDIEVDDVTDKKPPAIAYIDDNGINFDGDAASLPGKVRSFKSWLKKASKYEEEIYKQAEDQFMYHASPAQDIKKFRKSEDTSGNNKGKIIFVSKEPSFAAAFGARWNDSNARFVVETSNKQVPSEKNYEGTRLEYTDEVDLDEPCSMYKLKGNFNPLRYDNDIEYYTDKDVDIVSEEQFKTFRDMVNHYGVDLKKVSKSHILETLKSKKSSNFEKKASECEAEIYKQASTRPDDQVGKDGKIPSIEKAIDDNIARKVATMMATSHEYKTPNVDGALAMTKNYKWEETTEKIKNLQGINKPIKQEKVLDIAEGIQDKDGKVEPFIIVNQLNGVRPQTPGKKILFDGHHRMEACKLLNMEDVPVYKGTYTGGAQKSKEELREMDKTAMYEEQIYKEAMPKAWKKIYGTLSTDGKQRLLDGGFVNYEKQLEGLTKKRDMILKKNNGVPASGLSNEQILDSAVASVKSKKYIGDIMKANRWDDNSVKDQLRESIENSGGYVTLTGPKGGGATFVGDLDKFVETLNKKTGSNLQVPKNPLHRKYLDAVINTHEGYEMGDTGRLIKSKKKSLDYKGERVPIANTSSHISPKVVAKESADVAIAPKEVQKFMHQLRTLTGEVKEYKAQGLDYGKGAQYDKNIAGHLERRTVRKNRKDTQEIIDKLNKLYP